jgi:hypothetical protein
MRNQPERPRSLVESLARVAFTFVMMNCAAVIGALSALTGRKVWR